MRIPIIFEFGKRKAFRLTIFEVVGYGNLDEKLLAMLGKGYALYGLKRRLFSPKYLLKYSSPSFGIIQEA